MSSEGLSASEVEALPDRIAATFSHRTVFITGGTGFMGKVLVEKLLRKCPDIEGIILLVRPKKGKPPRQRLDDMLADPLFGPVIAARGVDALLAKLEVVSGDVGAPDLALSAPHRALVAARAHIIVHAAATIRFDEELRKAVMLNVRGTKLVLQLARECRHLELFVHISTAYCHLHEKLLEERPYPPPADPHRLLDALEWMDDDTVAAITPKLLSKLPNSYAYTKALGEALAVEAMADLPVIVLRPSIVIPIWQEPLPGWTDNINGPTGLLIGAGKGVLRTMYCKGDTYADYLPVDVFINGIMICAWNYIENGDRDTRIANFTSSAEIKVTWQEMIEAGREIITTRLPLNGVAWYPGGSMKHSRLQHRVCALLFHWLPALLVDGLLLCLGYKPVLLRVQRRISKGFDVFEYYTNNQWDFKSDVAQRVRQRLNARERRDYKVDANGVDISKYFEDCIHAARVYILKEGDETLPAARRHMRVMWCVDVAVRCLFWALLLYWLAGLLLSLLAPTPAHTHTEHLST